MNCRKQFAISRKCKIGEKIKNHYKCNKCRRIIPKSDHFDIDELCAFTDCTSSLGKRCISDLIPDINKGILSKGHGSNIPFDLCDELGIDTSVGMNKFIDSIEENVTSKKSKDASSSQKKKRELKEEDKVDWNFEVMDLLDFTTPEKKDTSVKEESMIEVKTKMESGCDDKEIQVDDKSIMNSNSPQPMLRKLIRPIPTTMKFDADNKGLMTSIAKLSEILTMQLMACSYY